MTASGNLPHVHVEEEPKSRTPYNNMNKYQYKNTKDEGNEADSAATKKITIAMPTSTNAEKEDDADSTATTTTTAATSISGSEWEGHITEGLIKTPPDKITYVFGERLCVKPASKWKMIKSQEHKEEKQMKSTSITCATTRSMEGVFMFGNAARSTTITTTMPTLQELTSYQKPVEQQKRSRKKASNWAKSGKFKVTNKKPGKPNSQNQTVRRHNEARPKSSKKTPYELRDEELKTEKN